MLMHTDPFRELDRFAPGCWTPVEAVHRKHGSEYRLTNPSEIGLYQHRYDIFDPDLGVEQSALQLPTTDASRLLASPRIHPVR
jgi:hypothetical protein